MSVHRSVHRSVQWKTLALLLAALWFSWALGTGLHRTLERQVWSPQKTAPPAAWRYGNPPARRFERFLDRVREHIPPGSRIAVHSRGHRHSARFFRELWAAYLLPEYEVLCTRCQGSPAEAEYVISYRLRLRRPDLEPIHRDRAGTVYRVLPP